MKYFTKYLPVEGEIKVGDYVRSESTAHQRVKVTKITDKGGFVTDERDFFEPDCFYVLPKEKATKMSNSLFLCSKDIQIGDEIIADYVIPSISGYTFETHVQKKGIVIKEDFDDHWEIRTEDGLEYALQEGCFKVIGEVSPEANWVTEGMEFEEQEIKRSITVKEYEPEDDSFEYTTYHPKGNETFKLGSLEKLVGEKPIHIQCPTCKHFH